MTVRKSSSCINLPSPQSDELLLLLEQSELEIEMQAIEMHHPAVSTKTIDATSWSSAPQPVGAAEWQRALQCALVEKHRLLVLLRKYQQLVRSVRERDFARYSRALDCSFRRRASTAEPCIKETRHDAVCETEPMPESEPDRNVVVSSTSGGNDDNETSNEHGHSHGHGWDGKHEEISVGSYKLAAEPGKEHGRRFSSSSSFLYAGVESTPCPTPVASPAPEGGQGPGTDVVSSTSPLLADIGRLAMGGWLYKYPRRQYSRLIAQASIPSGQLNYRYFWLAPHRSALCWSVSPEATELKMTPIFEFYTEHRLLPAGEGVGSSGGGGLAAAAAATVIIVITGKESPLALVPATNEDLGVWLRGLTALLTMKRSSAWPHNLSFAYERDRLA